MTIVIQAEGLSKSYRIGRRVQEPYPSLRDLVSAGARSFARLVRERRAPPPGSGKAEEFWALSDVSFAIEEGERVGIIGRNGAGKSTLLKILARITGPTRGRVTIAGRVASLLEVGTGFHPELTGRENVFLNGAVLGMTRAEVRRRFDEIVAFAEVDRFLDTPVKRYSSGMYVRLAFAVAAHLEPEILVVDEVLSVGDFEFQRKCLGKMEEAGSTGRTLLFVSHNLPTVLRLCPRSLLLREGRLVASGASAQVIQTYLDTKVFASGERDALRDVPRLGGMGERFRFTACAVLDSRGNSTSRLLFGEPFAVCVDTLALEAIDAVSVAIGFDTYAEIRVLTLLSEENGALYHFAGGQTRSITARPRHLTLKPGKYFLTLGARRGRQGVDQLSQALSFEVDSVPWKGTPPASEAWGMIQVPADWATRDA